MANDINAWLMLIFGIIFILEGLNVIVVNAWLTLGVLLALVSLVKLFMKK